MDSTTTTELVVKVSYGGVLKRFRVPVQANGQLVLNMASLREKIASLFSLSGDAAFTLTYSDEDGDMVALIDDSDLSDVTNQRLKFLEINVQLNWLSKIRKGINDVLMAVPNPKDLMDLISTGKSGYEIISNFQGWGWSLYSKIFKFEKKANESEVHDTNTLLYKKVKEAAKLCEGLNGRSLSELPPGLADWVHQMALTLQLLKRRNDELPPGLADWVHQTLRLLKRRNDESG